MGQPSAGATKEAGSGRSASVFGSTMARTDSYFAGACKEEQYHTRLVDRTQGRCQTDRRIFNARCSRWRCGVTDEKYRASRDCHARFASCRLAGTSFDRLAAPPYNSLLFVSLLGQE
jgi:hypothetical protein